MKSVLALIFALVVAVNAQNGPIEVAIYYNSLCTDTYRFIYDQLLPAYDLIKDHIELVFVPFGKSYWVDHGEYFLCQFGPNDCYGNILHLCGLQQICRNEQAQVDFIACEMDFPFNTNRTRPECSEQVGIDWEEVEECIENGFGTQLKLDAGRRTRRIRDPYPLFVPTIVYNGTFNQQLQNRSLSEFFYVVCELIDHVLEDCPGFKKVKSN